MDKGFLSASIGISIAMGLITIIGCNTTTNQYPSLLYKPKIAKTDYNVIPKLKTAYESAISVLDPNNLVRPRGSGVIIRNNANYTMLILTNYHVVKGYVSLGGNTNSIWIRRHSKSPLIETKLVRFNQESDLALLESKQQQVIDGPYSVLANRTPKIGEELWIIGSAQGTERNITRGVLSFIRKDRKGKAQRYRTDSDLFFGNSGGGVYNSNGYLTGLAVALESFRMGPFFFPIPGGGLCISLENIRDFLARGY